MASLTRNRPQEDEEFELSHSKVHCTENEPPEAPPTRLDLRDILVRKEGGGFDVPDAEWFDNVDGIGRFQRRPYDNGLTFVMGFQITWLELERIEDYIVKQLYTKTGRYLPGHLPERLLHLKPRLSDTSIRVHYLIEKVKKEFKFNEAPAHFLDYQIKNLITNATLHFQKNDNSAAMRSGKILRISLTSTLVLFENYTIKVSGRMSQEGWNIHIHSQGPSKDKKLILFLHSCRLFDSS